MIHISLSVQSVYGNLNTAETFSLYEIMMCIFPIGNMTPFVSLK